MLLLLYCCTQHSTARVKPACRDCFVSLRMILCTSYVQQCVPPPRYTIYRYHPTCDRQTRRSRLLTRKKYVDDEKDQRQRRPEGRRVDEGLLIPRHACWMFLSATAVERMRTVVCLAVASCLCVWFFAGGSADEIDMRWGCHIHIRMDGRVTDTSLRQAQSNRGGWCEPCSSGTC